MKNSFTSSAGAEKERGSLLGIRVSTGISTQKRVAEGAPGLHRNQKIVRRRGDRDESGSGLMESDPLLSRLHQPADRLEDRSEAGIVLSLHGVDLPDQGLMIDQNLANADEGPHDSDVHMDGPIASNHARHHGHTLSRVG